MQSIIKSQKRAIIRSREETEQAVAKIGNLEEIEEMTGKLDMQNLEPKLMHSVIENDKDVIDDGKLIKEAYNQGLSNFIPDLMFEQLVKNFSMAKQIYGETILKLMTGYDADYIEKNIKIPEFQKVIKKAIEEKVKKLKKEKVLDKENSFNDASLELASMVMYLEELDNITPKGIYGEKIHKKISLYGDREDYKNFTRDTRYRDIAIKHSVKTAIRRGHKTLEIKDLKAFERGSKGKAIIIYAMDSSGSMKGKKIDSSKKAGIALAFKALKEKDEVGLIVFGDDLKAVIPPTTDFTRLLKEITMIKASKETNIALPLKKCIELFPSEEVTKHLILLTDAIPTVGEEPEKETINAAIEAREKGITISLIGINLDKKGKELAKKIVDIGQGKLYMAKKVEEIDKIVLEDYYNIA